MSKTSISTNQELRKGESIKSANGQYEVILQHDNNFVIYKSGVGPTWGSATNDKDVFRLVVQTDGNLVMYSSNDTPVWHTNTAGNGSDRMRLTIKDDGKLVLDSNGRTIWSKP